MPLGGPESVDARPGDEGANLKGPSGARWSVCSADAGAAARSVDRAAPASVRTDRRVITADRRR